MRRSEPDWPTIHRELKRPGVMWRTGRHRGRIEAGIQLEIAVERFSVVRRTLEVAERHGLLVIDGAPHAPERRRRSRYRFSSNPIGVAESEHQETGKPARRFKDFFYATRDSWSRRRRVIGKAEHLAKSANPRFVVTSLKRQVIDGRTLYEKVYCARLDMENRIKECQLDLAACPWAGRTSMTTMAAVNAD